MKVFTKNVFSMLFLCRKEGDEFVEKRRKEAKTNEIETNGNVTGDCYAATNDRKKSTLLSKWILENYW